MEKPAGRICADSDKPTMPGQTAAIEESDPWVDQKPAVHVKNRLAKSTRYSRNAPILPMLGSLSGQDLATSFETFLDEARRINNQGYSLRRIKGTNVPAEMVMQMNARGGVKETASLRPKRGRRKRREGRNRAKDYYEEGQKIS